MNSKQKTWTLTRYPSMYRHKSGRLYARLTIGGKRTFRALGTDLGFTLCNRQTPSHY